MRILIAGIGNIFHGDDAFDVEVAQRPARRDLPAEERLVGEDARRNIFHGDDAFGGEVAQRLARRDLMAEARVGGEDARREVEPVTGGVR